MNDYLPLAEPSVDPLPIKAPDKVALAGAPAALWGVRPTGVIARRIEMAMSRLTSPPYSDTLPFNPGWIGPAGCPGDIPGRWLNAMCLCSQAWGSMHSDVQRCGSRLRQALNSRGYVGPVFDAEKSDENSLTSNAMMMYGFLAWTEATGDVAGLEAARSVVEKLFLPNKDLLSHYTDKASWQVQAPEVGCSGLILRPLALACRATGERAYLDLAEGIARAWMRWDLAENKAHAHASLQAMLGLLELYRMTGESAYMDAVLGALDLYLRHQTPYRGIANVLALPESQDTLMSAVAQGASAVARLAVTVHYTETCGITDWIELNCMLWALTGQMHYLDRVEMALWNGLMGSQEPTGAWSCLEYEPLKAYMKRGIPNVTWCCNMWGARGYAVALRYAYASVPGGALVHLYIPGVMDLDTGDGRIKFELDTDYPNSGTVKLTVLECSGNVDSIYFRIPRWSGLRSMKWGWFREDISSTRLRQTFDRDGYVGLEGPIEPALTVYLELDMPVRLENAMPGRAEQRLDQSSAAGGLVKDVAVMAGPCQLVLDAQYNDGLALEQKHVIRLQADGRLGLEPESAPAGGRRCLLRMPGLHYRAEVLEPARRRVHLSPLAELTCAETAQAKAMFDAAPAGEH